ncbi:MAG TPA: response regulator [Verrucomicrobiae bacterium]|nr:response regulator [Verrucomicrobiae bacterium]
MPGKILIVDDEKSIRESLSKVLRTEGYDVVLAETGQQAIDKMIQEPIDLLLLDLGLPVKDGWGTLRWLAQVNPLFPVIVITGRWKQAELAEAAGVDVLMEKPLNMPLLLQNISELLQESAEARGRKRGFRCVPCDVQAFCEQLWKRFTTPYRSGESRDSKNHRV